MKALFLYMLCVALLCSGCGPSKKITKITELRHEQLRQSDSMNGIRLRLLQRNVREKDSLIKVLESAVRLKLNPEDLKPAIDATGKKVERNWTVDSGRTSLKLNVDTNGIIRIQCKSDSLELVVKNLLYVQEYLMDSLSMYKTQKTDTEKTVEKAEAITKVYDITTYLRWALAIAAFLGVVVLLIKLGLKLYNKTKI